MEVGLWVQIFVVAIWIDETNTLADIKILAGDALKAYAPDRFCAAVIAADVLMLYILVYVVGKFEELGCILFLDTVVAEVVVGSFLCFVSFGSYFQHVVAFITF